MLRHSMKVSEADQVPHVQRRGKHRSSASMLKAVSVRHFGFPHAAQVLQRLVYHVGEALRQELPSERPSILSLDTQRTRHLIPAPPGGPSIRMA
jgi:hypothetical protein